MVTCLNQSTNRGLDQVQSDVNLSTDLRFFRIQSKGFFGSIQTDRHFFISNFQQRSD